VQKSAQFLCPPNQMHGEQFDNKNAAAISCRYYSNKNSFIELIKISLMKYRNLLASPVV